MYVRDFVGFVFELAPVGGKHPSTPENDGLESRNNGLGRAYDALESSGLL